ncbi:hypothetical protein K2D_16060 [Planctomycetes bacterium K2D]|uniref:Uncharacterized protein n=1 Tax=Botrimarina mediterranea TaxID=2528022 RepID=A0A518K6S3_9BACT|nr:hypothetical protein Spa11_16800 [Botrimarina mediterranea]QDV78001.1 hypothetical protein K2D_16060 [Planctomycetes bacterium K2D]
MGEYGRRAVGAASNSLLKYAIVAYFNLAKLGAKLVAARKTAAFSKPLFLMIVSFDQAAGCSTGC